jgi:hypothetical protein
VRGNRRDQVVHEGIREVRWAVDGGDDRGDGTGARQLADGNGDPTECRGVTSDQWRFTRALRLPSIPHPPAITPPLSSAPAARSLMRDGWVLCEGECVSQLRTPTRVRIRPFSHRVTDGSRNSQIARLRLMLRQNANEQNHVAPKKRWKWGRKTCFRSKTQGKAVARCAVGFI